MIYDLTKTKPRLAGRGFAQSTWKMFAYVIYRMGLPSANDYMPILPFASDGARRSAALLRGDTR